MKKIDKEALEKTFDEIVGPLREKGEELDLKREEDVEEMSEELKKKIAEHYR